MAGAGDVALFLKNANFLNGIFVLPIMLRNFSTILTS